MMTIKLLLADDHRIIRKGLRALLDNEPDMEVLGEAENGRETIQMVRDLSPDLVIMDVTMPELNGIGATRQILAEVPKVKVIALSMHHHEQFVTGMFMVGASGYLLKDCSVEELTSAIRAVSNGGVYVSPKVASTVIRSYVRQLKDDQKGGSQTLTAREGEVLQLVSEGKATREIASRLNVSPKTVETHRRQIMAKLGANSIAELTKYAIRAGITSLDT